MRLMLTTALILAVVPVTLHGQVKQIEALALERSARAPAPGPEADSTFTSIPPGSARPEDLHFILRANSGTRSLGWRYATKTEPSAGGHRHVGLGLGLGFLTGTLAGIAIGATGQHGETRTLNELRGAIGGALLGTVIGGTVGFFWRTEK